MVLGRYRMPWEPNSGLGVKAGFLEEDFSKLRLEG